MKRELSKREQDKITQENIEKFDEQYKRSRAIPADYKKKIVNRIIKNSVIAIIAIIYLILLNVLSLHLETTVYINGINVLCVLFGIVSVIYFEMCYRKNNGFLFMHGVEFLVLATITLFSANAYYIFFVTYNNILLYILIAVIIYYIIKTICTLKFMKKEYYKSQNDIKEIVKKGSKKND